LRRDPYARLGSMLILKTRFQTYDSGTGVPVRRSGERMREQFIDVKSKKIL